MGSVEMEDGDAGCIGRVTISASRSQLHLEDFEVRDAMELPKNNRPE
jgi:hypothetical protein